MLWYCILQCITSDLIPIGSLDFERRKVTGNVFIFGVVGHGLLRPIYDSNRVQVIERENTVGNTRLTPLDLQHIPYNNLLIYDILPGFRQYELRVS